MREKKKSGTLVKIIIIAGAIAAIFLAAALLYKRYKRKQNEANYDSFDFDDDDFDEDIDDYADNGMAIETEDAIDDVLEF